MDVLSPYHRKHKKLWLDSLWIQMHSFDVYFWLWNFNEVFIGVVQDIVTFTIWKHIDWIQGLFVVVIEIKSSPRRIPRVNSTPIWLNGKLCNMFFFLNIYKTWHNPEHTDTHTQMKRWDHWTSSHTHTPRNSH